jgi:hypothetical protein
MVICDTLVNANLKLKPNILPLHCPVVLFIQAQLASASHLDRHSIHRPACLWWILRLLFSSLNLSKHEVWATMYMIRSGTPKRGPVWGLGMYQASCLHAHARDIRGQQQKQPLPHSSLLDREIVLHMQLWSHPFQPLCMMATLARAAGPTELQLFISWTSESFTCQLHMLSFHWHTECIELSFFKNW